MTPDGIDGYYMVNWVTDDSDDLDSIVQQQDYYTSLYYLMTDLNIAMFNNHHPLVRNYHQIIEDPDYYSIKIIDTYLLPTGEMIGIPRGNFWLKIFQRRIKNWYANKIEFAKSIRNLMYRETNGRYPKTRRHA